MKKLNVFIVPFLFLFSCINGNGKLESETVGADSDSDSVIVVDESELTEGAESFHLGHDSLFCADLTDNLKTMSENERFIRLANPQFWANDTLSREQFIVLFNYLDEHQSDEKTAIISDFLYEHFKSNSSFSQFDAYFKLHPEQSVLEALTFELLSAWSNENEAISEADFKVRYRYLYNKGCIKYFRTFKDLEN